MKFHMKKKGIILLEAFLAMILFSMVSYGVAETSTVQYQQMTASKVASQAQDYAEIEAKYLLELGYEDVDSLGIHDRTSMESLIGVEGWESETKIVSTKSLSGGKDNAVKVVSIDVYKEGDSTGTPRYSVSVPLVKGLAVYTKDEIDAMVDKINTDITGVNTDLQSYKSSTNTTLGDLQNQITNNLNQVNADLDALEKKIEANSAAIAAANINISKNAANIETINTQISSIKSTISSLQGTVTALQNALAAETSARQSADNNLQNNINDEITARKAAVDALTATMNSKIATLQNQINTITGRLDGKEFVKSKDQANDIQLKYEADASGNKAINAYVDGTKVPLSSQGNGTSFQQGNGYYITSDGLMLQWGIIDIMDANEGYCSSVQFNVPFPHECLNVQMTVKSAYNGYHNANGWPGIVSWNKSSFVPYTDFADRVAGNIGSFWFAIGY